MKVDSTSDPTARRVHQRGKMQKASFLAGPKVHGMIQTESVLEATLAFAAMIDPRVERVRPQPLSVDLNSGRVFARKSDMFERHSRTGYRPAPYTPDFELRLVNGETLFVETKPKWVIEETPEIRQLPAVLAAFGMRLILVTDQVLNDAVAYNVRLMRRYVGKASFSKANQIIADLGEAPVPFRALTDRGLRQGDALGAILQGALTADLTSRRIGPKSLVTRADGSLKHLEILPL